MHLKRARKNESRAIQLQATKLRNQEQAQIRNQELSKKRIDEEKLPEIHPNKRNDEVVEFSDDIEMSPVPQYDLTQLNRQELFLAETEELGNGDFEHNFEIDESSVLTVAEHNSGDKPSNDGDKKMNEQAKNPENVTNQEIISTKLPINRLNPIYTQKTFIDGGIYKNLPRYRNDTGSWRINYEDVDSDFDIDEQSACSSPIDVTFEEIRKNLNYEMTVASNQPERNIATETNAKFYAIPKMITRSMEMKKKREAKNPRRSTSKT